MSAAGARALTLLDAWRAGRGATAPELPGGRLMGHLADFRADRLGLQRRLAAFAPVARFRVGPFVVHAVSGAKAIQEVLVDEAESFVKSRGLSVEGRPLLGDGLLTSAGAAHARARKLLAPAFTPKRLATYGAAMASEAARTVGGWRDGQRLDLGREMMRLTLGIVGKTLFGVDMRADAEVVERALTDALESIIEGVSSLVQVPYAVPIARHRKMRAAVAALDAIVLRVLAERRRAVAERGGDDDRGDVLSTLLAARDEAGLPMSDAQLRDEIMTLMIAGHETTANALTWTLHALAREPARWDAAAAEVDAVLGARAPTFDDLPAMPGVLAALEEGMRLWPPAYTIGRQATRDVTIGGHRIGAGGFVMVNVYGLHRDPVAFPEPDRFLPERMLPAAKKARARGAYLPFGAGPRVCIGNHFALVEGQLALATVLQGARLELAEPRVEPRPEPLVTLRPAGGVPIVVRRR